MGISDWCSGVCSSDLRDAICPGLRRGRLLLRRLPEALLGEAIGGFGGGELRRIGAAEDLQQRVVDLGDVGEGFGRVEAGALVADEDDAARAEERRVGKGCVSTCRTWRWT